MRITQVGEVMQLAYVPQDFDEALTFWIETMGAGPFHILSRNHAEIARHRGEITDPELTTALGHWGDMQIEIIRQENDAPSLYREWRDAGGEGLHHVCVVVDDIEVAKAAMTASGAEIIFEGQAVGAEWFYADTGGGPGTMVEVIRHSEQSAGLMAMIRESSRGWDGSDPIRYV